MSNRIPRRAFLGAAAAGAAALSPVGRAFGIQRFDASQPNILLIVSDEHKASVTHCFGNSLVQTPNLDALAAGGVRFANSYTNSPLCVPMRLALTAGKYISRISAWNNSCRLASDSYPSIAHSLNAVGYESYLCGKMHYDPSHRYGFTELYAASTNQGVKNGKGNRRAPDNTNVDYNSWTSRAAEFKIGNSSGTINHDKLVTTNAVQFLQNRSATAAPFFLLVGYLAPHFPLTVPQAYYDPYQNNVAMPVIPPGHLDSLSLNYVHLRRGFGVCDPEPDAATVQYGRELYYGLTQWMDNQVSQVLAALAARPFASNTIIIYTSDHGENMGEHGMWWKNCMYEHASHVPLIVNWPARWVGGQSRDGVCSTVDIVQTIAELAGATAPSDWNGDSLVPLLDSPAAAWKDMAVSEYYAHNIASGFTMLRQGQWKYVYHTRMNATYGPQEELYDLAADPGEFTNLASAPEHAARLAAMHAALVAELGREPDDTELIARQELAAGYGSGVADWRAY
ncbi:MAG: sulfatase-like hydrolase/transferase [Candidatus Sumerlaeota bacterium]|nr:sulfatase-like hydrolase/transferase [Candidatus Sumerlaeota bacterium]